MSPLHAARATVGLAWAVAISCVVLALEHPVALAALLTAVLVAGAVAGAGPQLRLALLYGIPFALLIALVNALVVRDGVTVLVRGWELPWGQMDITLEALGHGLVLGARALIILLVWALHSAAVDADELLRSFRRLSFRSGLTAALALRLMPVLARDGRRVAEAQRCRPGPPASRLAVLRAVVAGALERATDVAATLEVRGYALAGRPPAIRRPWSRHDASFALSAAGLVALVALARPAFDAYPRLDAATDPATLLACLGFGLLLLVPFADRRGIRPGAPHPHAWRPAG